MGLNCRVVTLNTWKCDGDYQARLAGIREGLGELRPDIVFLQEAFVCPSSQDDTAQHLGQSLGLQVLQLPSRQKHRVHRGQSRPSWSNLAILSTGDVLEQPSIELAHCDGDTDRWIQMAEVCVSGVTIRLCNTHFTHVAGLGGDTARLAQAEQLIKASDPANTTAGLTVLGGDLNTYPEQAGLKKLLDLSDRVHPKIDDVVGTLQTRADTDTSPTEILDYLFVRRCETTSPVRFLRQWTALDTPMGPTQVLPSDHAAVVADLLVAGETAP